jgi:hypothetical protein
MDSILGQSEPQAQPQVFACAQCGEMINSSMAHCPYCRAHVDPQWAIRASIAEATINSGFNFARNIMFVARGYFILNLASFLPIFGVRAIAYLFFCGAIFVVPVLVLIWFSKYQWGLQGVDKNHGDLKQARRRVINAAIIWGVTIAMFYTLTVVKYSFL